MANDPCGPETPSTEPMAPGTRIVHCVKFDKDLPGLDRVPWRGELGKRVYENVSKDAWKLWIEHSKMIMTANPGVSCRQWIGSVRVRFSVDQLFRRIILPVEFRDVFVLDSLAVCVDTICRQFYAVLDGFNQSKARWCGLACGEYYRRSNEGVEQDPPGILLSQK